MAPAFSTDEDIVARCVEGRSDAWDLFVDRFSKLIYWSITKTLSRTPYKSRTELVREIFQEVFERLLEKEELQKLRSFKSIKPFLSVLACHRTLDKVKSLSR